MARHLEARGFRLEARNWSCRAGELDIVAVRDDLVVFVEVRSFSTGWAGTSPTVTVSSPKQRRVARAADYYLRRRPGPPPAEVRFDVVGVRFERGGSRLEHIENAFVPSWGF